MLTLHGQRHQNCDGVTRRDFISIGSLGIAGLSLPSLLRAEEIAGGRATGKSVINIYLAGGPTHLDTFDLKPQAPREFRGEFQPISTNVPGMEICEFFSRLASHGDKLAIIRSITGLRNEHAPTQSDSGWSKNDLLPQGGRPGLGPVMSKILGPASTTAEGTAPTAVDLTGWTRPGFLGQTHSAYRPDNVGRANLTMNSRVGSDRFERRSGLLGALDRFRRQTDATGMMDAMDSFTQRAAGLITSGRVAQALDLKQESPETIDRYGARGNRDAERFVLARRLIEAGVRNVAFSISGWDTHNNNFATLRDKRLPPLDQGLSALLEDLNTSGRLAETIIMMSGEFGRTPRVNSRSGRDHWPRVGFFVLAGGGLRTGQVIGSTNRLGELPDDRPVHLQEVFSTVYHQLGIDVESTTLQDPNGRPQYLVNERETILELV